MAGGNAQGDFVTLETVWHFLTSPNTPYEPVIMSFSIYPKRSRSRRSLHMNAALSPIASTRKESGCPSVGDWVHTLWYNQTMKYLFSVKEE